MILHTVEQRSPEWYSLRLGKPTTSDFSRIVTATGKPSSSLIGYAAQLAAEMFVGHQIGWDGNAWTERGKEMESDAVRLYEFANDCEVQKVGFVTDDGGEVGCSPDGLIGADGMLEIKSLKADNHVKAIMYHRETGKCPPDYVQQTQGQLLICERQWVDLFFYYPELPSLTITQTADAEFIEALRTGLRTVIAERDRIFEALQSMKGE